MTNVKRILERIPRPARIALDLLLAALLLFARYIARGAPPFGEEAAFRRAEKAAMLGPSELIDRYYTESDWPLVPSNCYNLTLLGDAGDAIYFYTYVVGRGSSDMDGVLTRREKTDGLLLTTIPSHSFPPSVFDETEKLTLPLLLFVDDPTAVKAELTLLLPNGETRTLTQKRGNPTDLESTEGPIKERYFRFLLHGGAEDWRGWMYELMYTGNPHAESAAAFPATIRLFDAQGRLLRTVEYTIRGAKQSPG